MMRFPVALLTLLLSAPSWGLTLADLVSEGGFIAPNETVYSNFRVKIKGGKKVSRNLADYEVTLTDQGFVVKGAPDMTKGDGRMIMKYVVSARTELPIENAMITIGMDPGSMFKAKRVFRVKKKKVGKLFATPDDEMAMIDFGGMDSIKVKDVVFIWGGFPDTSSANMKIGTSIVPEPATALLLGSGLAAMAALRSRRRGHATLR